MLRKALLKAFFFLFLMVAFASPAFAFYGGGGYGKRVPDDSQAPLSNGMEWFVRRVPVLLYNPASLDAGPGGDGLALKDAQVVWGELWTKPGWAKENTRFGLNELYIPVNPGMTPAPAEGMKKILVPYGNWDDDILYYFQDLTQRSPQVRVIDKNNVWAADASDALYVYVPLPSREALLSQAEGMNEEQMARWGAYLKSKDPEYAAFGGLIPSADPSTSRFYVRALDAFGNGGLYYYHLILNAGPQSANWSEAANTTPYYDEPSPSGKGFYRGKDWSEQLEKNPASVPGFIGAIDWWANLKLTGPNEVVGVPGEEKEVTFTFTNESGVAPSAKVGVKREGEQKFATVLEGVTAPAWGNSTFALKFKVEDRPYKVRVAVIDPSMLEADYKDNVVELAVKPLAPDMYVKVLDPGTSEAEPGRKYTGTVVFGLAADYPVPVKAALSVTNNGWAAPLADGSGRYFDETWLEEFQPGEEKAFNFTWTGDASGNTLVAKVHPATPPDDRDWSNNSQEVYVPPAGCDLAVRAWPFMDPVYIAPDSCVDTGVNIRVTRKDGGSNTVTARVTVSGPAGTRTYTVDVPPGGSASVGPYRFQVCGPGTYTVHVEAWPEGRQDSYPDDNTTDVAVRVVQRSQGVYSGPKEPGLHVELGD